MIGLFFDDTDRLNSKGKLERFRDRPRLPNTGWKAPKDFPNLFHEKILGLDVETYDPELLTHGPGWARGVGHIVGVSVATASKGWYFPIKHETMPEDNLDPVAVFKYLADLLGKTMPKVGANILYDLGWLQQEGVAVKGITYDVQYAQALLDNTQQSYSLETIANQYLKQGKDSNKLYQWLADWFGGPADGKQRKHIYKSPPNLCGPYAESDAKLPVQILLNQFPKLKEDGLWDLFVMECQLIPVWQGMRFRGVPVDIPRAHEVQKLLIDKEKQAQLELDTMAGFGVGTHVTGDLQKLFDKLNIKYPVTDKGNPSFTQGFLSENNSNAAVLVNNVRKLNKARVTFVENAILDKHIDGKIYPSFHPLRGEGGGTITGRLCVAKGQRVAVPGGYTKIEDIRKDDLVYSFDALGKLRLKKVTWAGCTGHKATVKLNWIGTGNQHTGTLCITKNHQLLHTNMKYVSAENTKVHDRIMALHQEYKPQSNRNLLYPSGYKKGIIAARFIWIELNGFAEHVHHIDHNSANDTPSNLKGVTAKQHFSEEHIMTEKTKNKIAETMRLRHKSNPELWRDGVCRGENHPVYKKVTKQEIIQALRAASNSPTKALKYLPISNFQTLKDKMAEYGMDTNFSTTKTHITKQDLQKAIADTQNHSQAAKKLNVNRDVLTRLSRLYAVPLKIAANHAITSITDAGVMACYDIEVEDTHNFICEELCIHNSSSAPNIQQIPSRDKIIAPLIRGLFIPEKGYDQWMKGDFAQIEYKSFAHISQDKQLIDSYQDPTTDYHNMVSKMLNDVLPRPVIKNFNFGSLFGMGRTKTIGMVGSALSGIQIEELCHQFDLPCMIKQQALQNLGNYFADVYREKFPTAGATLARLSKQAAETGEIRTLLNRRCLFNMWESSDRNNKGYPMSFDKAHAEYGNQIKRAATYKALNSYTQGSSADLLKKGILDSYNAGLFDSDKLGFPHLTVHDELGLSYHNDLKQYVVELKHYMENAIKISVPITFDIDLGPNWYDGKEVNFN